MKLSELRTEVYRIAEVQTTRQLKAQYAKIKPMDMRYKASWEKALTLFNQSSDKDKSTGQAKSTSRDQQTFDNWLDNPPGEYQALFAEAEAGLAALDQKLDKAQQLTKTVKAMTASLDEFAEASVAEAHQLAQTAERAHNLSKQADLN